MDELVRKVVALGVPGLVLVIAMAATGLAGAAAITTALAALGGPLGMLGGIAMLALIALISDMMAKHGGDAVVKAVIAGYVKSGTSKEEIWRQVKGYPITKSMKRHVFESLWPGRPYPQG